MKKILTSSFVALTLLFANANAKSEVSSYGTITLDGVYSKEGFNTYKYNISSYSIYKNGLTGRIKLEGMWLGDVFGELKKEHYKKDEFIQSSFDVALGYSLSNSDFNLAALTGFGYVSERYSKDNTNKVKGSAYVPFIIWNRYQFNEYFALQSELQYNLKIAMKSWSENSYSSTVVKENGIGHDIKLNMGVEILNAYLGGFVNYYPILKLSDERSNVLSYGFRIGIVF